MAKRETITVQEGFNQFITKCKIKNLTDESIKSYNEKVKHFMTYYGEEEPLQFVTQETVDNFILWLQDNRTCGSISINSYLRSLRAFLYFCMDKGYTPHFKIQLIKAEKKLKETYSDTELEKLLKKPDINNCDFREYEVWVLENYLLGTGNRISTALELKIKDIDFEAACIYIRKVKNRHQQIIPLSTTLSNILQDYIQIRGNEPESYLFCNLYGNKPDKRTFQDAIKKYNRKRGVTKTSAHLFRHTFAKNWIIAGGDIFRLQKILGHSDLTVTKEYVSMFGTDLQIDFEKFNPLDKLNNRLNQDRIRM